jgi:EAL domain-containing protein (putative c-di-GMP-specific phosphodiesterase class I)
VTTVLLADDADTTREGLVELLADTSGGRRDHRTARVRHLRAAREAVNVVHERGMRVAVDDMGSGFAGLQRLVDVKPEIVKLDRLLTARIDTDPTRRALIAAMRQFADDLGLSVIAEGVEREAQLELLLELGVTYGQGYLLGRPAPLPSRGTYQEKERERVP